MMFGVSIAMLAAALQASAPTPMSAPARWSLDYQPGLCQLTRTFGDGTRKATFGLRQAVADTQDEIILLTYGDNERQWLRGSVKLVFGPSGQSVDGGRFSSAPVPGTNQRLTRFMIRRPDMVAFDKADVLTVKRTGQPDLSFDIKGVTKALDAMSTCEGEQMTAWGVDPSGIATWAKPIGSPAEWFDFPFLASERNETGDTIVRWLIDEEGHAHDCVVVHPSGHDTLDAAACTTILKRARYQPATGKDGKPKPSLETRRIVWALPMFDN